MPGYLIQSLNFTIDLMIQHKYKNWIEVWRFFFVRTLLLFIRFSSEICFLSEIFPSEVFFLSECCCFCVSGFPRKSSFCQISFKNLLLSVRFPSEIYFFVRFPSEISFFVRFPSEIFFLSSFLQKAPSLCQFSLRNLLLSVRSQKYPSFC